MASAKWIVPDDFLVHPGLTETDCRIEPAVRLRSLRRITMTQALRISRLGRSDFEDELARRDVRW